MINYLRRTIREIGSLQNLDLHFVTLSVPVALMFGFLSIRGVDYSKYVPATILWFIGFLATGILADRRVREDFQLRASRIVWRDNETDFKARIQAAQEISVLAVSPYNFLNTYRDDLERVLQRDGGKVRFMFVNADESAMQLIKPGRPVNDSHSREFFIEVKKLASKSTKGALEVKSINYIPSCIMTMIDDCKNEGAIFVTTYSFKQVDTRPSSFLTRCQGGWYNFYQKEFNTLWDAEVAKTLSL
jgi:hypothetical protein